MKSLENPNRPLRSLTLEEIDARLSSDAHYASTPSRNYGLHDPVREAAEFVFPCDCGHARPRPLYALPTAEQLQKQGGGSPGTPQRRHFIECAACGKRGRATSHDWSAVIEWNREHASAQIPVGSFPFFLLAGLSLEEAREKVKAIRHDLELRRAEAKKRSAARIETGRTYRMRIDAYLGWSICASTLIKVHLATREAQQATAAAPDSAYSAPAADAQAGEEAPPP